MNHHEDKKFSHELFIKKAGSKCKNSLDDVVYFYLELLSDLYEEDFWIKDVCSKLLFILPHKKTDGLSSLLKSDKFLRDEEVHSQINGFNRLLSEVLKDYSLSFNKEQKINELSFLDEKIKKSMILICDAMDLAKEIQCVGGFRENNLFAMIFLTGLNSYLDNHSDIHHWILTEKKNLDLAKNFLDFHLFSKKQLVKYCVEKKQCSFLFFLTWLSLEFANSPELNCNEAEIIQKTFALHGYPIFSDLCDLGFFSLPKDYFNGARIYSLSKNAESPFQGA